MSFFKLNLLGTFEITIDDTPVTDFRSDKVRALLTYLALEATHPLNRQTLATLLWPEMSNHQALLSLRVTLHRLRQALDTVTSASSDKLLTVTRQTIQVNPSDITIDVGEFQTLLTAYQGHEHPNLSDCPTCITRLKQAAEFYKGEFLEGFSLSDALGFDEWQLLQRELLHQQAVLLFKQLADLYESQGDYDQAYLYSAQLLNLAPYREDTHRQLMRILAYQGLPDQALAQYDTCCQIIGNKLGKKPGPETVALAEQIRRGELGPSTQTITLPNTPVAEANQVPSVPLDVSEKSYRARLKSRYSEDAAYYIDLGGETTELAPLPHEARAPRSARRRRQRAQAEYHEWIQVGPEIHQVKLTSLREGVDKYPSLILLGDPGSGKTTALENLAYQFADDPNILPLPLRFSEFETGLSLLEFITQSWGGTAKASHWNAPDLAANLQSFLEQGKLFILFDALNEMPRDAYKQRVQELRAFIDLWAPIGNRFLVTCRVLDYGEELTGLQRVEVQPLNNDQLQLFLQNELPQDWEPLWQSLVQDSGLLTLARNPYMLTMMIDIYIEDGQLGRNRAALMRRFTQILMKWAKTKYATDEWLATDVQRESLAAMAFEMQKRVGSGAMVKTNQVKTIMPQTVQPNPQWPPLAAPPDKVLTLAAGANIIEMAVDRSTVRFYHQLLQEYYVAHHMLKQKIDDLTPYWSWPWLEDAMPLWIRSEGNYDPLPPPPSTGWEESIILTAGLMSEGAPLENDYQLIQALTKINPVLAGRCLHEGQTQVDDETRQAVISALLNTIAEPEVALRVRIVAAEILGHLGDPRPGELVTVPAGPFWMGSDWQGMVEAGVEWLTFTPRETVEAYYKFAEQSGMEQLSPEEKAASLAQLPSNWREMVGERETPYHQLHLPQYQIGKYSVTNAEYHQFIEVNGYQDKRWWTEAGWALKTQNDWNEPSVWQDGRLNQPNQPVVGVSWYEAVAYCHWLSAETGEAYRLPTEVEWEKAARGIDGYLYPWGDTFEPGRLNMREGPQQVLTTTPVGVYPTGVSPFGLFDCAGNVWDWCATKATDDAFKPYPYKNDTDEWSAQSLAGTDARVLRGGSWSLAQGFGRCAYRSWYPPEFRNVSRGFRVLVAI
ncbi:MAG: SUMF1/EgtB/PvdO family nonheme iron enzyme [Chloroflexota bacterium]